MENKEIYIDGVDVSNCDEFMKNHRGDRNMCNIDWEACTAQCGYGDLARQLKRKEKKCEELYKEKDKLNLIIDRLLEASGYDKDTCSDYDFENIYSDMRYKVNKLEELKQALQEIKGMCKKHTDFCKDNKKNFELCSLEPCDYILILQKISEVEE